MRTDSCLSCRAELIIIIIWLRLRLRLGLRLGLRLRLGLGLWQRCCLLLWVTQVKRPSCGFAQRVPTGLRGSRGRVVNLSAALLKCLPTLLLIPAQAKTHSVNLEQLANQCWAPQSNTASKRQDTAVYRSFRRLSRSAVGDTAGSSCSGGAIAYDSLSPPSEPVSSEYQRRVKRLPPGSSCFCR